MGKPLKVDENPQILRNRSTDFFVYYISVSGRDLPAARDIRAPTESGARGIRNADSVL